MVHQIEYIYIYNAKSQQTYYSYDSNGDGNPERIDRRTYDANGNITSYIRDNDGNGSPNVIEKWTYDANGYQTGYTYDSNGNGTPNRITNTDMILMEIGPIMNTIRMETGVQIVFRNTNFLTKSNALP